MTEENLNLNYHVKKAIIKAMKVTKNNNEAADELGVSRRTFGRLLNEHGLRDIKRTVIPLKKIDGHLILTSKPNPKILKALNQMVELAFNNL